MRGHGGAKCPLKFFQEQGSEGIAVNLMNWSKQVAWARHRAGQSLIEYMWILVLVSIIAVVLLKSIGSVTNNMLADVNEKMPR